MTAQTTFFNSPVQVGVSGDNLATDNTTTNTIAPGDVLLVKEGRTGASGNGTVTILLPLGARVVDIRTYVASTTAITGGTVAASYNGGAIVSTITLSTTSGVNDFLLNFVGSLNLASGANAQNSLVFTTASVAGLTGGFIRHVVTYTLTPN